MFKFFSGKPKPAPAPPPAPAPAPAAPVPMVPGIKVNPRATYSNGVHKNSNTPVSIIQAKFVYVTKNYDYEVAKSNEDKFQSGIVKFEPPVSADGDPRSLIYNYTVEIDGTKIIFGDKDYPKKYYFRTDMVQSGGRKSRKARKNRKSRKARKNRKSRKARKNRK